MFFENSDASGMSRRTISSSGVAFEGDGGEVSPVEADPMGGNVGTATPYIEILPPYEPPQEFPDLLPMTGDSPLYVNGQQVTCSLDGMAVGCASAMQSLENGSAIPAALAPYQHLPGFSFQSQGLGIYTVEIPRQIGWHVTYDRNDTIGTANPVYSGSNSHSFSVSWQVGTSIGVRSNAGEKRQMTAAEIAEFTDKAISNISKECGDFIVRLARQVSGGLVTDPSTGQPWEPKTI